MASAGEEMRSIHHQRREEQQPVGLVEPSFGGRKEGRIAGRRVVLENDQGFVADVFQLLGDLLAGFAPIGAEVLNQMGGLRDGAVFAGHARCRDHANVKLLDMQILPLGGFTGSGRRCR